MKSSIENVFLASLGSVEKLKWYLENDVDVLNYLQQTHSKHLFIASALTGFILKKRREKIAQDFNSKRILSLIEKERPDLYPLFSQYPNSKIWLEREIERFKKRFL